MRLGVADIIVAVSWTFAARLSCGKYQQNVLLIRVKSCSLSSLTSLTRYELAKSRLSWLTLTAPFLYSSMKRLEFIQYCVQVTVASLD